MCIENIDESRFIKKWTAFPHRASLTGTIN
jgi:hypothetical protein